MSTEQGKREAVTPSYSCSLVSSFLSGTPLSVSSMFAESFLGKVTLLLFEPPAHYSLGEGSQAKPVERQSPSDFIRTIRSSRSDWQRISGTRTLTLTALADYFRGFLSGSREGIHRFLKFFEKDYVLRWELFLKHRVFNNRPFSLTSILTSCSPRSWRTSSAARGTTAFTPPPLPLWKKSIFVKWALSQDALGLQASIFRNFLSPRRSFRSWRTFTLARGTMAPWPSLHRSDKVSFCVIKSFKKLKVFEL